MLFPMKLAAFLLAFSVLRLSAAEPALDEGFKNPPVEARLHAYWWWLNGNVTKAAITRDLEWMKSIGMGGALLCDAGGPAGPTPTGPLYGSPEWRELFRHALKEADRLGLEMSMTPQSGWNLGGPDVTPDEATKHLTFSETEAAGPARLEKALPEPPRRDGCYRDTHVVAYRMKEGQTQSAAARPKVTVSSAQHDFPAAAVLDDSAETFWVSAGKKPGQGPTEAHPEWIQLAYEQPVGIAGVRIVPRSGHGPRVGEWQASPDGKTFKTVQAFSRKEDGEFVLRFPETAARYFRLLVRGAFDRGDLPQSRNVQIAGIELIDSKGAAIAWGKRVKPVRNLREKSLFDELGGSAPDCSPLLFDIPGTPGEEDVRTGDVVDITAKLDSKGVLRWDVPAGTWQILRFGCTNNGGRVSTSSGKWQGLVVDYLDADAVRTYWRRTIEPLLADAGPLAGKVLKGLETDSWEGGGLNWTARLPEEFAKRRGYGLIPWLPVFAGKIVENREATNRFLADFRKTVAECMADNHYGVLEELARAHGMFLQCEASGPHAGPFDGLRNYGHCERPMGEFWVPSPHRPTEGSRFFTKAPASAAHIYGRRIACAEGFTSIGPHWNDVLWSAQKPSFDHEACAGLNLVYWHAFTCSPPEMGVPGQEYFAGTHFDPNITWANQAHAFVEYLNRCQFLLQQGLFVADVCSYYGDHVPNIPGRQQADPAKVLPSFDYDVFNEEVLLTRMDVKDGRIVLPDGMSYRVLVLPEFKILSLPALRRVAELVKRGATVVGPKPERDASLTGFPASGAEFKRLADELWDGGKVIAGKPVKQVLAGLGVLPDFDAPGGGLNTIHRRAGDADLYFVSNPEPKAASAMATFRVAGKQPELWDPVSGTRRALPEFEAVGDGRTRVPLEFPPYGSYFVIFKGPAASGKGVNFPKPKQVAEIAGAWSVTFDPKWGGPSAPVRFDKLDDWTRRSEGEIQGYSGTAVYRTTFDARGARQKGVRWLLDLGEVAQIAEVRLNGKPLGVAWTPPFRVDATGALVASGNKLEVSVVNTWYNRLAYERALPAEKRLLKTNVHLPASAKPLPSGLLGPVRLVSTPE